MKELSIEEKAKRYDEAIEVARKIKNGEPINVPDGTLIPVAIFPELAESEDERIRKWLINYFREVCDNVAEKEKNAVLAWLEKQGQTFTKKDVDDAYLKGVCDTKQELEKQGGQKPWSEEDENRVNRLIAYFEDKESFTAEDDIVYANWLKSIRPNHWKPSDEQMKILNEVLNFAANHENSHWNDYIFGTLHNLIIQLKKLREE